MYILFHGSRLIPNSLKSTYFTENSSTQRLFFNIRLLKFISAFSLIITCGAPFLVGYFPSRLFKIKARVRVSKRGEEREREERKVFPLLIPTSHVP